MKQLSTVLNGVLLIAVIILFVLHFQGGKSTAKVANVNTEDVVSGDIYPVAIVKTDSLIISYEYAKELSAKMMNQEEASRADFNSKVKIFQQDAAEFQRKVQNNGFLSVERANQEQERLAKAERALQELNQRLSNELMRSQEETNAMLRDSIFAYMKDFGADKPYKLILSNRMGDNVLYNVPSVDITSEVLKGLNERYAKLKKK